MWTASARSTSFAHELVEDTVELRVREVLEEKLAWILEEFGVDKSRTCWIPRRAACPSKSCTRRR